MIPKVPLSSTVEAGSFRPVRKHPLMLVCSESGPNEAQPCSALQPHACSHHQLPNSQLNRCLGKQLSCLSECSAQSFNSGRGEPSYTCRQKPSGDEFGSHLLQLPHDPFSDQSKSMVLQPLPKMLCSPGPESHGKWCFPI